MVCGKPWSCSATIYKGRCCVVSLPQQSAGQCDRTSSRVVDVLLRQDQGGLHVFTTVRDFYLKMKTTNDVSNAYARCDLHTPSYRG